MLQTLDDKEIAAQRSRLGMVFQRFNLFPHMTALENVMEAPIHVQHQSKKAARDLAVAELQRVGLGDRTDYYPSQLSGTVCPNCPAVCASVWPSPVLWP